MAKIIIKQPNDKYCIFSTVVDNLTIMNLSFDDLVDMLCAYGKKTMNKIQRM